MAILRRLVPAEARTDGTNGSMDWDGRGKFTGGIVKFNHEATTLEHAGFDAGPLIDNFSNSWICIGRPFGPMNIADVSFSASHVNLDLFRFILTCFFCVHCIQVFDG